ncbi:MAG: transcription termination factor Rho [Actinomycetota bacterium]
MATVDKSTLEGKVLPELQEMASSLGLSGVQRMKKGDLINKIVEQANGKTSEAPKAEAPKAEAPKAEAPKASESSSEERPAELVERPTMNEPSERPRGGGGGGGGGHNPGRDRGPRDGGGRGRDDRGRGGRRRGRDRDRDRGPRGIPDATEEEIAEAPVLTGILDVLPEGYGFLRTDGYLPSQGDIYVSLSQIRRFHLRKGDEVEGAVRRPKDSEKYFALLKINSVNGLSPEEAQERRVFEKLTPLFPEDRYRLEHDQKAITERIIDLVAPIGKGQRGMVVSPPKAGKTTVLKEIAKGILEADPKTHVMILLVDERPEEVTDWQRTVEAAEVVYSTFDKPADQHIQVTELVLERAKRLVEAGQDVAILLDSITRLARAYNLAAPASGKILSGGVDSTALYPPKRFFGAARNIEEGGSLTIIASALVETGSRMDEVIFEEFKGTGNMELRLDRELSEKRIFPAINIEASGTRKEERLMPTEELALTWRLRRVLHALQGGAAIEMLIDKIRATKSNEQFLKEIAKAPVGN